MTGRSFRGFHRSKCLEAGLVQGDKLSVDGSFVEANANKQAWLLKNSLAELPPKMRRVTRADLSLVLEIMKGWA
jgi:hypothetical protein